MPFDESVDPMTGNRKVHKHNAEKSQVKESQVSVEPYIKLSDQKKVDVINGYAHYNISVDISEENETNNYFEDKLSETLNIPLKEVRNIMDDLPDDFMLKVLQGKIETSDFNKILIDQLSKFEAEV
ncbi:MAG: hypothetical protein KAS66_11875 [Candidatus Omnitrophica bacterium]|nr:hypothetical protein [Candidatus Omnitrophota bacterium]